MKKNCLIMLFCCLLKISALQANNAAWVTATGGDWNTDANWTAPHPDGTDAIAGFLGFPTSAGSITSTSNISVGSLVLDTTTALNINLGNTLTFSSSGNANLFVSGASSSTISCPVTLDSNLDIFIINEVSLSMTNSIDGTGALSIYGSTDSDRLVLSGNNSYSGGTFVKSNILELSGPSGTTTIPGNIDISALGLIQHLHDDHYSPTTEMSVHEGSVDINTTTQNMLKLTVIGGFVFGSGTVNLLATSGNAALTIGDNSQVNPAQINLINGGGIVYDSSSTGTAFLPGPTIIDLQGHSVDFNVPHNFFNCIDVDTGQTDFQNGTLNKTGNGDLLLQGGSVPTFNIVDGTVIIGDQLGSEVITATGPVTIFSSGTLAGFQTFAAQAGVVNSGTIRPGNPCSGCSTVGTLTIQGDHAQTVSGTLAIKALNSATSDQLVVDGGAVTLNGELNFDALPGATFVAGDQIVVINNPNETTPIAGQFSSFVYNLPPCLQAAIVYNPHQVIVKISNCPCPAPPLPPSDFIGTIKKCRFLNKSQCSLEARWTASPSEDVVLYRIYKDGHLVKTVPATSPLVFVEKHLKGCSIAGYEIAAVNADGVESSHVKLRKAHD